MTLVSNMKEDGKPIGRFGKRELNWHMDQSGANGPCPRLAPASGAGTLSSPDLTQESGPEGNHEQQRRDK